MHHYSAVIFILRPPHDSLSKHISLQTAESINSLAIHFALAGGVSGSVRPPEDSLPEWFSLDAAGHSAALPFHQEAQEASGGGAKLGQFDSDWLWGSIGDNGCGFWSVTRWIWN